MWPLFLNFWNLLLIGMGVVSWIAIWISTKSLLALSCSSLFPKHSVSIRIEPVSEWVIQRRKNQTKPNRRWTRRRKTRKEVVLFFVIRLWNAPRNQQGTCCHCLFISELFIFTVFWSDMVFFHSLLLPAALI